MDAMAFGMGSCCLQITFQAKNIEEGRKMYDQLSPLGPILLALTAATPIYKGFLADTDVRWNQIGNAVDDRTPEELGEKVTPTLVYLWEELSANSFSHLRTTAGGCRSRVMRQIQLTFPKTPAYVPNTLTPTSSLTKISGSA
jgi:hypothetical protein